MGILRVVEWRSTRPVDQTDALLRSAVVSASVPPADGTAPIVATSKRSLRKNRAATVRAEIAPRAGGSNTRRHVNPPGRNQPDPLREIADHLPDGVLDDRGITAALARAGLLRSRGRHELRHLHRILRRDETVIRLGRGHYRRRPGILVLSSHRLLFIDKHLPTTGPIDEVPLTSVASISVAKSRRAETLIIHTPASRSDVSHIAHGQAGGIAAALRHLTANPPQHPTPGHTNTNPATHTGPPAAPANTNIATAAAVAPPISWPADTGLTPPPHHRSDLVDHEHDSQQQWNLP